jgi:isopentenyl phosphate kinase
MKELVIIKLGGSVITDKKSDVPKVNYNILNRLAEEIAEAYQKMNSSLIIIHGAGSYGHQIVKKTGINKGIEREEQLIAFAETQRLQNELNSIVTKVFIEQNLPAIPIQASSSTIMENCKLLEMNTSVIKGLLEIKMIPVLYGVPAYDINKKCSILSGDEIAPYLASQLGAKKIIHGTNVEGIFTDDPNINKEAKLIPLITKENFEEVKKALSGSACIDVTGGMLNKVIKVLDVAKKGIEVQFVNALVEGNIKKALLGEKIGTLVRW